jgi:hypothetical protein
MKRLLNLRVSPAAFDEVFALASALLLVLACSYLTFHLLAELGRATGLVVLSTLSAAWAVLGWQAWVVGRRLGRRRRPVPPPHGS